MPGKRVSSRRGVHEADHGGAGRADGPFRQAGQPVHFQGRQKRDRITGWSQLFD